MICWDVIDLAEEVYNTLIQDFSICALSRFGILFLTLPQAICCQEENNAVQLVVHT